MSDDIFFGGLTDRMLPAHIDAEGDEIDDVYHVKYDGGDKEEMIGSKSLQHAEKMVKHLPVRLTPQQLLSVMDKMEGPIC